MLAFHQAHARSDDAPGDHDAGDPEPRTDLAEEQIAGQIKKPLAEKENPRTCAVDRGREHQIAAHLERCEPDIDPIQVGQDIQKKDVGDDVPADLGKESSAVDRCCLGRRHRSKRCIHR